MPSQLAERGKDTVEGASRLMGLSRTWIAEHGLRSPHYEYFLPEITKPFAAPGVTAGQVESILASAVNTTDEHSPRTLSLDASSLGYMAARAITGLSQYVPPGKTNVDSPEVKLRERLIANPLETLLGFKEGPSLQFEDKFEFRTDLVHELLLNLFDSPNPVDIVAGFRLLTEQPLDLEGLGTVDYNKILKSVDHLPSEMLTELEQRLTDFNGTIGQLTINRRPTPKPLDTDTWPTHEQTAYYGPKHLLAKVLILNGKHEQAYEMTNEADDLHGNIGSLELLGNTMRTMLFYAPKDQLTARVTMYQEQFVLADHTYRGRSEHYMQTAERKIMRAVEILEKRQDINDPEVLGVYEGLTMSLNFWGNPHLESASNIMFKDFEEPGVTFQHALIRQKKVSSLESFTRNGEEKEKINAVQRVIISLAHAGELPFDGMFIQRLAFIGLSDLRRQTVVRERVENLLPENQQKLVEDEAVDSVIKLLSYDAVKILFLGYITNPEDDDGETLSSPYENPHYMMLLDRVAKYTGVEPIKRLTYSEAPAGF